MLRLTRAVVIPFALMSASPALADAPKVVTDIPAVHSLVAQVMQGFGEPVLVMRPGSSPHNYAMRPSEARALSEAEMVIWVGPGLTPWLERAIETLGPDTVSLPLLDAPGTMLMEFREGATFEAHDHDHHDEHADHKDEDHADHKDEHDHKDEDHADHKDEDHADHKDEHHDEAHGDHEGKDPHAWLDPHNAEAWLDHVAEHLAEVDPDNAALYQSNADSAKSDLEALEANIEDLVGPAQGKAFIVFHDAYQYFEAHFGVTAAGAVTLGDGLKPSAARIVEIRERIEATEAVCVFSEPQFEPKTVQTVIEGTDARSAVLDPVGADLELGPQLYGELLTNLATNLVDCLSKDREG